MNRNIMGMLVAACYMVAAQSTRSTGGSGKANMADSTLKAIGAGNMATESAKSQQAKQDKQANLTVGNTISAGFLYGLAHELAEVSTQETGRTAQFVKACQSSTEQAIKDALRDLPSYYATEATKKAMASGATTEDTLAAAKSAKKSGANAASAFRTIYQAGIRAGWNAFDGLGRLGAEKKAKAILEVLKVKASGAPVLSKEQREENAKAKENVALHAEASALCVKDGKAYTGENVETYLAKATVARREKWAAEYAAELVKNFSTEDVHALIDSLTKAAHVPAESKQAEAA